MRACVCESATASALRALRACWGSTRAARRTPGQEHGAGGASGAGARRRRGGRCARPLARRLAHALGRAQAGARLARQKRRQLARAPPRIVPVAPTRYTICRLALSAARFQQPALSHARFDEPKRSQTCWLLAGAGCTGARARARFSRRQRRTGHSAAACASSRQPLRLIISLVGTAGLARSWRTIFPFRRALIRASTCTRTVPPAHSAHFAGLPHGRTTCRLESGRFSLRHRSCSRVATVAPNKHQLVKQQGGKRVPPARSSRRCNHSRPCVDVRCQASKLGNTI